MNLKGRLKSIYPLVATVRLVRTLRPVTFQEKVRYKMARDRRAILNTYADKVAARDYAAERIGDSFLTHAYAIVDDPKQLDWGDIPREFVCKVSHGSGGIIVSWAGADPDVKLPRDASKVPWSAYVVHPDRADPQRITSLCQRWLTLTYGWGRGSEWEWVYRNIPPRVIVEELLTDREGHLPQDYRFYVFHGRCRLIQVETDWLGAETRRDFFTPDWERIAVTSVKPGSDDPPTKPPGLGDMIEAAEALATETDFLRVDLYNVDGRIVLGELTSTPSAGLLSFNPPEFSVELGRWWTAPRRYR
jgi:hypothetical protein